ncbi:MAG: nucleotide exchange factor GrpE [Campylobacteraceae bacterium]|nr:nucleotide exchange factor GrpE [Campylobacteraceae bacterium]
MSEAKTEEVIEEQVESTENETVETETNEEVETEVEVSDPVSELETKLKEAEDKYLRVHADFENIKKRLEREKYQAIDYASEKFAKDLLAPIDSLEMAMSSATADLSAEELLEKLKEGINLTIKNFNTAFEKHDISLVETDGHFDPNFHNAIMQVEDEEKEDGDIVQVMQKGYKYKERLLRPAMVSICKK